MSLVLGPIAISRRLAPYAGPLLVSFENRVAQKVLSGDCVDEGYTARLKGKDSQGPQVLGALTKFWLRLLLLGRIRTA